jgi:uncharacterized RDD family membrane protein YckC
MEESYSGPASDEHMLDDFEYTFTQASSGKRFVNLLVDRLAIYLVWNYLLYKASVALLRVIYEYTHSRELLYAFSYLITVTFFVFILAIVESSTGGKTLGKLITGTRAVNQDGSRISPKTAILPCLSRLVPFEAFSALGKPSFPWHDRWTKTYVIDEALSSLPPVRH